MSSFVLKILALLFMLCDHFSSVILNKYTFLNLIGRMAFTIFAFQAAQGYIHSKSLKKHMIKLLIFGIISQMPFSLASSTFTDAKHLNIFFTLFLGLLAIYFYDKIKNKLLGFFIAMLVAILANFIQVDYGAYGVILIFLFFIFRNDKYAMILTIFALCFFRFIPNIIENPNLKSHYLWRSLFMFLPVFIILFYNKKEGPKCKYLFYIAYPLHLTIFYLISIYN